MCCVVAKRETICYSEVLIVIYQPVNCNIAEDRTIKTEDVEFPRKALHSL